MLFPALLVDIHDLATGGLYWSTAIPPGVSPMRVAIKLILAKLLLKVSRRPEEGLIQARKQITRCRSAISLIQLGRYSPSIGNTEKSE